MPKMFEILLLFAARNTDSISNAAEQKHETKPPRRRRRRQGEAVANWIVKIPPRSATKYGYWFLTGKGESKAYFKAYSMAEGILWIAGD